MSTPKSRSANARKGGFARADAMTPAQRQQNAVTAGRASGVARAATAAAKKAEKAGDKRRYFAGETPDEIEIADFLPEVLADNPTWRTGDERTLRECALRRNFWMYS